MSINSPNFFRPQKSEVLILSRTQMTKNVCVGGFDITLGRNIRLLTSEGSNQPENSPFQIGQLWEISYNAKINLIYPHTEDVIIKNAELFNSLNKDQVVSFINENCRINSGSPSDLFDGLVNVQPRGASFIDDSHIPNHSVCFWRPIKHLTYTNSFNKSKYNYLDEYNNIIYFPYVGLSDNSNIIPAGSIIRISLARWWSPPNSTIKACYLQISGWY